MFVALFGREQFMDQWMLKLTLESELIGPCFYTFDNTVLQTLQMALIVEEENFYMGLI